MSPLQLYQKIYIKDLFKQHNKQPKHTPTETNQTTPTPNSTLSLSNKKNYYKHIKDKPQWS